MTLATAPILAFGVTGVRAAARFEDALVEIQARAGLTEDQLETVRTKALEIGRDTAFSAGQGAEALLQLTTAGLTTEQALASIDAVINGAAASGENLGLVADSVTNVMASFNLEAEESAMVVDAIAAASASSNATMNDLFQGFANVGGQARQFGLSVADTAAILATFSTNGIKGAEAGTQLRSMLRNMTRDTDDVTGTWERLNISLFTATGEARPLNQVMQELSVAMAGMSDQERINTLQTLGGAFGALGLGALTTGEGMDAIIARMDGATSAAEIAEARLSTFSGSLAFLRGSIETFQIEVLSPLMENVLQPIVKALADIVNQATEWVKVNPELAATIIKVLTALVAVGPTLFIVGKLISLIGTAIALLASPIGIVMIAIAALAIAWETNFLGIRDALEPVIAEIQNMIAALLAGVDPVRAVGDTIRRIFGRDVFMVYINLVRIIRDTVLPALQNLANWFLSDVLPLVVAYITDIFIPLLLDMANFLIDLWRIVEPHLISLADWFLTTALPGIVGFVTDHVFPLFQELARLIGNLWDVVGPKLLEFAAWFLETALPRVIGYLDGPVTTAFNAIISVITTIVDGITGALDLINRFIESGQNLGDIIPDLTPNISGLSSFDPRKLFGTGGIVTQPTPAIIGDNVPAGSFEAVLQEPQLRALLNEVKGGGGGGDIIINAEPGTLNIGQDPATQGMILAEALERRLQQAGIR
jgi:TP901 family phage tail tape measure protein